MKPLRYTDYKDWKAEVDRQGLEMEFDGTGKMVAHLNGDERGIWYGGYGGAGYGWFF